MAFLHQSARQTAAGFRTAATALKRRNIGRTATGRFLIDLLLLPPDIYQVSIQHRYVFGRFPNFFHPQTFMEWLNASKVMRRKARYRIFVDKLLVRDFVRSKVGDSMLTKLYWSGDDILEAKSRPLPTKFAVKANHTCGDNMFVRDAASFDWDEARRITQQWLAADHSTKFGEWQYRWVAPKLLIEELLEDPDGGFPVDYKFFCFHGRARIIEADLDRYTRHTRALFDRDFNLLAVKLTHPTPDRDIPKPALFAEMREIAETLSQGEAFLRVDLYDIGRPVFGELTLHPAAGLRHFEPPEWDRRLYRFLIEKNA